jgi:glycosyltransferase involved in cell wall biosynthesis
VLARAARPRFWTRDERGRFSLRQLGSAGVRVHRKNVPWLARLAGALAADPRAAVDFRVGPGAAPLDERAYLARLGAGDVYVCASFMEGGPLPVMEAVLAGLAVVTTPVGQTAEWVTDGENGFVCGSYAELARACRRYLDDPGLLAAHRARSRAVAAAKAFDADRWEAFLRGRAGVDAGAGAGRAA